MSTIKLNFAEGASLTDEGSSVKGSFAIDSSWFTKNSNGQWTLNANATPANVLAAQQGNLDIKLVDNHVSNNELVDDHVSNNGDTKIKDEFTTASKGANGFTLDQISGGQNHEDKYGITQNSDGSFTLKFHNDSGNQHGLDLNFSLNPNKQVTDPTAFTLNDSKSFFNLDDTSSSLDDKTFFNAHDTVVCFAKGTQVTTQRGLVAVEKLKQTDTLLTVSGNYAPLKWVGHRRVDCKRHSDPAQAMPVCIHKDAFGENLPMRDLFLSPLHSVYLEGHFIPALDLVNGLNVTQEMTSKISYYHVELENHNVIYVEGLPAESYLDDGNRSFFSDTWVGEDLALITPEFAEKPAHFQEVWDAKGFASVVRSGPIVEALRATLLERSQKDMLHAA